MQAECNSQRSLRLSRVSQRHVRNLVIARDSQLFLREFCGCDSTKLCRLPGVVTAQDALLPEEHRVSNFLISKTGSL